MSIDEYREIMKSASNEYVYFDSGDDELHHLDGNFSADQLAALAWAARQPREVRELL